MRDEPVAKLLADALADLPSHEEDKIRKDIAKQMFEVAIEVSPEDPRGFVERIAKEYHRRTGICLLQGLQ